MLARVSAPQKLLLTTNLTLYLAVLVRDYPSIMMALSPFLLMSILVVKASLPVTVSVTLKKLPIQAQPIVALPLDYLSTIMARLPFLPISIVERKKSLPATAIKRSKLPTV